MMLRYALLLALAPALAAAPAIAQTAPAATQIEIPFAPPLDTVLRFRITNSETVAGKTGPSFSWVEELRFVKSGDGFILHWRMDPSSFPAEMRTPITAPLVAPFTGAPIAFDLDDDGALLQVRDWESLRPKMLDLVDKAIALRTEGDTDKAKVAEISAQIHAMFESVDAEGATGLLLKNIAPVLIWGDTAMELGKPVTESREQPVPMFGASILQNVRTTLTAIDPGQTATIEVRSENDPASFNAFMVKLMQRFAPDDPAAKDRMAAAMEQFKEFSVVDESIVQLDIATALPRVLTNTRNATAAGVKKSETLRIEWLR